ncbi:hypothetical protein RDI58_013076 [Solanum bulbocastanum]|uniref:Uncharacterized protein n=1 Tax=Solanum bulbocastanum TaxID=147425 RepID=A0AAN8TQ74_SOLBU
MAVLAVSQPLARDKTPPQHIQNTTDSTHKPTYVAQLQANSSTRPISKTELKPIKLIHGEPTIKFTMDEVNEFIIEEGLHQAVILKLFYGKPDLHNFAMFFQNNSILKVGAKNQNDATDKGTDVEQYQGDAREIINAKFQSKSNKEQYRQFVPNDNSGEGRDSRNNLGVDRDATVDRGVANSSEEATIFNPNNEENLENKGKSIKAARRGVGKDGVLGLPNVVVAKQDNSITGNSNNKWTLVSHKKWCL